MKHFLNTVLIYVVCFSAARTCAAPIAVAGVKRCQRRHPANESRCDATGSLFAAHHPRDLRGAGPTADIRQPGRHQRAGTREMEIERHNSEIILRTDEIQARVNRATGAVSFFDKNGAPILAENPDGGKSLTPNRINGMNTLRSRQEFVLAPEEAIYGLGQHPDGRMNYCGATVHLQQRNPTESAVPVLVSSRGYGILWDNPAITDVSVGAGAEQVIPAAQLCTETGEAGGLTARYYRGENFDTLVTNRTDAQVDFNWSDTPPPGLPHDHYSVRWDGFVQARARRDLHLHPLPAMMGCGFGLMTGR